MSSVAIPVEIWTSILENGPRLPLKGFMSTTDKLGSHLAFVSRVFVLAPVIAFRIVSEPVGGKLLACFLWIML